MGDRHRDPDALTSLYGRRSECAALDGLLDRVRGGPSAVLVLRGEAGIGKTALLRYLTERAAGFSVARCMGVESEMELAFTGLHDLCTPMLSYLDALVKPQREALSVALGLASGEPPESFLVALAALNLLAQAAEDRPLLCIVDDMQWLDQATAGCSGSWGGDCWPSRWGWFLPPDDGGSEDPLAGLPDLRLSGLDQQSAHALLASVLRLVLMRACADASWRKHTEIRWLSRKWACWISRAGSRCPTASVFRAVSRTST